VRGEDFSSYLSKLSTPRELMIIKSCLVKLTVLYHVMRSWTAAGAQ
jgi:hypothetical protein